MSRHSRLCLGVNTAMKDATAIVLDGFVFKVKGGFLNVKLLVPSDGSAPQILHHAPGFGVLSGHDILEFCEHAVNEAHHWLSRHKLLEQHDLTSADDWRFYGTFGENRCAFESRSLNVLATIDAKSRAFSSFVGCMVKQGEVYRAPSKRLGARLLAKIVMAIAIRAGAPSPSDSPS